MALADSAGAAGAFLDLPRASGTTIESKTDVFAAVRGGVVCARPRPLHRGRSTIVVRTDVFDGHGTHVARTTQTQAVLDGDRAERQAILCQSRWR